MVTRIWRGWTANDAAQAYSNLLQMEILPAFTRIKGYKGAYVLRRCGTGCDTEFVVITLFTDMEAVRRLAGENYEQAIVPARAKALLCRYDEKADHYESVTDPKQTARREFFRRMPLPRMIW